MRVILTSIITSILTMSFMIYGYVNYIEVEETVPTVAIEQPEVCVTEVDMNNAISKVYNATVHIQTENGSGSGFVYKTYNQFAYIITNHHVIEGANEIGVTYADKSKTSALVVAADNIVDIAVLMVDVDTIIDVAMIGDSDQVVLGEKIITVGSPIGIEFINSVTQGYVSGLDRQIEVDVDGNYSKDSKIDLIQIDAAINPGNSGGPLVNSKGQVVGVNTIKYSSASIEAMGFSIPINQAKEYAEELLRYGEVIRPTFGIGYYNVVDLKEGMQSQLDINSGIYIDRILKGKPAEKAGILPEDVITAVNGVDVNNSIEFTYELFKYNPGDEIDVLIYRDSKILTIKVLLDDSIIN